MSLCEKSVDQRDVYFGTDREPTQDHCGILVKFAPRDGYFFDRGLEGLRTLQTRGYDGAGVWMISEDGDITQYKKQGLVDEVFKDDINDELRRKRAKLIAYQVRYGTKGEFISDNVQPLEGILQSTGEPFVVVHNGQFAQTSAQTESIYSDSVDFRDELEAIEGDTWGERIIHALKNKKGAFSLAIGTKDVLYLARDVRGIRPLVYGNYFDEETQAWVRVATSETIALNKMGMFEYLEVLPGEIVKITNDFVEVIQPSPHLRKDNTIKPTPCAFEIIYTKEGQSIALTSGVDPIEINYSESVAESRARSGIILAREAPIDPSQVDFAIGIPGTGIPGGIAYARALGIEYKQAITDKTPQNDQRTFMMANKDEILQEVLKHFNFDVEALRGSRVVLIDDSLVRGNIMTGLIKLLKEEYGVLEVHVRILSPPFDKRCYLGVNTRKDEELIIKQCGGSIEKVRVRINADSLAYLSRRGLREALTGNPDEKCICMGCMQDEIPPIDEFGNETMRLQVN